MTLLLEKDLRLLAKQKKLLVLYVIVFGVLGFQMETSFLISYVPMIWVMLSLSTISYDDFDNGSKFLMTLPFDRREYALSKYVFSGVGLVISWAVALVVQLIVLRVKGEAYDLTNLLIESVLVIPVFLLILSVMIPVDLKYGTEKGRYILFAIFGIAAIALLAGKEIVVFLKDKANVDLTALGEAVKSIPTAALMAALFLIGAAAVVLSAMVSIKIMRNKEY